MTASTLVAGAHVQRPRELARFAGLALQLVLLALVVREYELEGPAFYRYVMPLAAAAGVQSSPPTCWSRAAIPARPLAPSTPPISS